jgi:hypothetical protein
MTHSGENLEEMGMTNGVIRVSMLQHALSQRQMLDPSSG